MTREDNKVLHIGEERSWSFMHGKWADGPDDELVPPTGRDVEYMAVKHDEAYADFTARFRFRFRGGYGGARFLFRVQDSRRFYALDIPRCGQQNVARHFWAGIVVADGTPLQRYLNFNLVPGLCARCQDWYEARVEVKGSRLRAWIEGRLVADVEDSTYEVGRLGLCSIVTATFDGANFARLEVQGTPVRGPEWHGLETQRPHWITPCPETDPNVPQSFGNLIQSKSGGVALGIIFGNPNNGEVRRGVIVRSTDGGRTWSPPEAPMLQPRGGEGGYVLGGRANFVRQDGTWVCVFVKDNKIKGYLYSYESPDEGRTWIGPRPLNIQGEWPEHWVPVETWRVVRMHDGVLVLPVIAGFNEFGKGDYLFRTSFTLRSEDDGLTWSQPVWCDSQNSFPKQSIEINTPGHRFAAIIVEVAVAEVTDNVLLGIGRPLRDPYMWQIQSNDGGRTWEPAAIGPFPGYCPSLTRTASGALVATTRFPHFAAHLSRDNGRTWDLPVIVDYAMWANQEAIEVEPDVVLVSYMGDILGPGKADSRIARLRVTPEGLRLDH
jgi:hypothetical protein